jgi:hypothetical protein
VGLVPRASERIRRAQGKSFRIETKEHGKSETSERDKEA